MDDYVVCAIKIVLLLPFQSVCLLFHFLALLHWLGFPVQRRKKGRLDIPDVF